jgi:hypothetical protein
LLPSLLLRGLVLVDRLAKPSSLFPSEAKHNPSETRIQYCDIEAVAVRMPLHEPSAGVSHMELLTRHGVTLWNGGKYLRASRGERRNEGIRSISRQSNLAYRFGRGWKRNNNLLVIATRSNGELKGSRGSLSRCSSRN